MPARSKLTHVERVLAKVEVDAETGCWIYTGAKTHDGYGRIGNPAPSRRSSYTHRVAYENIVGPIPEGLTLDHLCRTRACCNPAHLEPVTNRENILRGTSLMAVNAAKTECLRGHPLAGVNLFVNRRTGARQCRECRNARQRAYKARRRAARSAMSAAA